MSELAPQEQAVDKRALTERVLNDVLKLMDMPASVESKDGEDGGVAVALHPEGELLGFAAGKRSPLIEALQFLVNKVVNPPTGTRRWVSLAVGGFPAPKPPGGRSAGVAPLDAPAPGAPVAVASPPSPQPPGALAPQRQPAAVAAPRARAAVVHERGSAGPGEGTEETMTVEPDAPLQLAIRTLAERSASLGRFYAVTGLSREDRARVLQASRGVPGMSVLAEGDGRHRRIVFRPDKPAPMAKTLPDDDEEDDG